MIPAPTLTWLTNNCKSSPKGFNVLLLTSVDICKYMPTIFVFKKRKGRKEGRKERKKEASQLKPGIVAQQLESRGKQIFLSSRPAWFT